MSEFNQRALDKDIATWLRAYAERHRYSDTGEMYHAGFMLLSAVAELERLRALAVTPQMDKST
jgi:hypothetical protein